MGLYRRADKNNQRPFEPQRAGVGERSKTTGRQPGGPGGPPGLGAQGHVHTQAVATDTWIVSHTGDTKQLVHKVFDASYNEVFPDSVELVDINTVRVTFAAPMTGFVHLLFFTQI